MNHIIREAGYNHGKQDEFQRAAECTFNGDKYTKPVEDRLRESALDSARVNRIHEDYVDYYVDGYTRGVMRMYETMAKEEIE